MIVIVKEMPTEITRIDYSTGVMIDMLSFIDSVIYVYAKHDPRYFE